MLSSKLRIVKSICFLEIKNYCVGLVKQTQQVHNHFVCVAQVVISKDSNPSENALSYETSVNNHILKPNHMIQV